MATESKKTVRQELTEKLAECKRISVNGVAYFGKITENGDKKHITMAVPEQSNMTETTCLWIKTYNLNNLKSLKVSGNATYAEQELTEDEQYEVDAMVVKAALASARAIPTLINQGF